MLHPDADQLLTAEIVADAARIEHRRRDLARHRGVTWSGLGPETAEPRSPAALQAAAETRRAARQLWGQSSKGRLLSVISACQAAAHKAHAVGERARAGAVRGEPPEWSRRALDDLSNEVDALAASLNQLRRAICDT